MANPPCKPTSACWGRHPGLTRRAQLAFVTRAAYLHNQLFCDQLSRGRVGLLANPAKQRSASSFSYRGGPILTIGRLLAEPAREDPRAWLAWAGQMAYPTMGQEASITHDW